MKKTAKKDYEILGKMLVNIYESGYINENQTYKNAFLKGIIGGVGGVIGATLVVTILIWVLSLFKQVPLLGPVFNNVKDTIQKSENK